MGRPRLLAVGPALDQSSYARVLHATLGPLAASWEIVQLAVNHRGAPTDIGWRVLPNRSIGDRYGVAQIPALVAEFAPHAVFVFNSFINLPRYWDLPARLDAQCGAARPVLVSQCPVLGEATDPRLVGRHASFDCVAVLSQSVRSHFADSFESCLHTGWIDRMPTLEVIPHGIDAGLFHRLPDKRAARAAIPALADLADDGFVVLNANRNEPRKGIDVTLEGFARFARGKPGNVKLYLHMGETPDGNGLVDRIRALGIADKVVLASSEPGGHPRLDDAALNRLYNACDVGLNTASSEGWGMVSFEHAAAGAAQIVPGGWVCGEVWRGSAELLGPADQQPDVGRHYTRETLVSAESVAQALERLYTDPSHRAEMARRAAALATAPCYQWSSIASRWDGLLRRLCTL
ncbi:MAG TPA: glycosyltransferase [Reyranella sp.]|nr:glycosyltransferase [Reyranella sp.]